jgi:putative transposase
MMDNYATHKTSKIKARLAHRLHWHVHFSPTSVSWINQAEPWFFVRRVPAQVTEKARSQRD